MLDKNDRNDKNRATPTDSSDFLYVCNYYAMAINGQSKFLGKFLPCSLQPLVLSSSFCLKSWNLDMLSL